MKRIPAPKSFEAKIASLLKVEIEQIALRNPEVSFYGFALDANIDFGSVWISLNSVEALRTHCKEHYANKPGRSLEEREKCLKWQFGDWSFKAVNKASASWSRSWDPLGDKIQAISEHFCEEDREDEWEEWKESFLEVLCQILIELERGGSFSALSRTSDFKVMCADHDESVEDGEERMKRMRSRVEL